MNKRILTGVLAAVMAVSLTACSDSKESGNSIPANNSTKNNNTNSVISEIMSAIDDDGTLSTPTESTVNSEPGTQVYTDAPSIVYSPAEDFEYWYNEAEGGTMIRGYIGAGGEVAIPKEIDGKPVTIIDKNAFKDNTTITSIYIPSTIKKIDKNAFEKCTALETVTLKNGLETIGEKAFYSCEKLKNIEIPDTVTKLEGKSAGVYESGSGETFSDCIGLEAVIIGKGIDEISTGCFKNCSSLKSVTIPGNVKTINKYAFYQCTSLETVVLEERVETIFGADAFSYCSSLANVTLPESLKVINFAPFSNCTSLTDIEIPGNCKLNGWVFSGCTNIRAKFRGKTYTYDQLDDLYNATK